MAKYDFEKIEKKWQRAWEEAKYGISEDFSDKPKFYSLMEFPYPSGSGLHVGHCMGYTASDAYTRMKRMQGYNVLFPMGWDAFGLPTENYAIKTKSKPKDVTKKSIATFKSQMKSLGYSFDWMREVDTTDPNYFKWTQWIFMQFYKHAVVDNKLVEVADDDKKTPRLAFQAEMPVNWCPSCKIILANEEVIGGNCERCGAQTEKRKQKQWMLRITAYADRLIKDLDTVDYLENIKTQQINWIGRSEGTEIDFKIVIPDLIGNLKKSNGDPRVKPEDDMSIKVYTTRADTLFGCTYVVLAPEHELISHLSSLISNFDEVEKYIEQAKKKSDMDRTELAKEKTGVELKGIKAINPINGEEVSVWIADYVLATYGTGAVMAVPAHDERDWEFAKKYNIDIKFVIEPKFVATGTSEAAIRPELPLIKRNAACVVVRNPKDDKYLCVSWKNFDMHGLITGGIEPDEDLVDAAKREITEETGYKNLKYVRTAPLAINTQFFHRVKKENRWAHFQFVFFDLEDEEQDDVDEKEKNLHDIVWKSKAELKDYFTVFEGIYLADLINNGENAFTEYGILANSGSFDGLESEEGKKLITKKLKEIGAGDFAVNFKLRDWIFSRQHYWGEPIPIIHCSSCGTVPMDEKDLPLTLPEVENYEPTDTGESPLAAITDWVNTTCPKCGGPAKRETDTMPNWAGSSWYFLAYAMQANYKSQITNHKHISNIFDSSQRELKYWMPVDLYNGGNEHTTLHLLYSRFWHKFLYDLGKVPTLEPYNKRIAHGIILGADNQKMSKSRGNVVNPDDIVARYGADALRTYIMFIGPYDKESAWNMDGLSGVSRFLSKVWENADKAADKIENDNLVVAANKLIFDVENDLERFNLNTYVAKLMTFNNLMSAEKEISKETFAIFCQLLSPAAPHLAEEIWQKLGNPGLVAESAWPKFDKSLITEEKIKIAVQVNGKLRDLIEVDANISKEELEQVAKSSQKVGQFISGKEIKKVIAVPGKIVNIVI